jgi:hypothetical protein
VTNLAWWVGTPPAVTAVACGPNQHHLRWEAGRLTPLDHADPAVEAVLADLGGEEPACMALCRYWAAHAADPRVLTLAGRHPGDTIALSGADVDRVRSLVAQDNLRLRRLMRGGAARRGGAPTDRTHLQANEEHLGLIELLAVDPALGRRLQSEVAHNLSTPRPLPASNLVVLEAATVGRLTPIARRWSGADRHPTVRLGDRPGVEADRNGVTVTVRPTWLTEIWGRYLGVVDHFLVIDVQRVVDDRAEVTGVGAPAGEPARLTLRGPAPWHVERRRGADR